MIDFELLRKDFPMLNGKTMQGQKLVFLDNASTTFKPYCVIHEIQRYYSEITSNSHRGDYDLCFNMDQEVLACRKTVANFVNCNPEEVVFTSGTTMSINLVAWGLGMKHLNTGDEIIISEAEHASNSLPWFSIAKLKGAVIKFVPLDEDGRITVDNLKKVINDKTKIVALAHVGNVLGYILDLKPICELVHSYGAFFVVDGAQSVPHMKVDFKDTDIDLLSFSAHKMCGPTGVGVLVGKYSILDSIDPFLNGGGNNAKFNVCGDVEYLQPPMKFEAGTIDLAGILGLSKAIQYIQNIGIDNIEKREKQLRQYAIKKLEKLNNVIIYNKKAESGIITFNVKGVFAQDEATLLNSKGIAVRSGEHCAKMLNDFLKTPATCRASLYFYTSQDEIDVFVDALAHGGDFLDAYFNE